jgi:hypothetical protein
VNEVKFPGSTLGVGVNWLTWSRAGDWTSLTATVDPVGALGQPVDGVLGVAVTTAVGTVVAGLEPSEFDAVTTTRRVF